LLEHLPADLLATWPAAGDWFRIRLCAKITVQALNGLGVCGRANMATSMGSLGLEYSHPAISWPIINRKRKIENGFTKCLHNRKDRQNPINLAARSCESYNLVQTHLLSLR
jgi:hypothetical protein